MNRADVYCILDAKTWYRTCSVKLKNNNNIKKKNKNTFKQQLAIFVCLGIVHKKMNLWKGSLGIVMKCRYFYVVFLCCSHKSRSFWICSLFSHLKCKNMVQCISVPSAQSFLTSISKSNSCYFSLSFNTCHLRLYYKILKKLI